MQQKPSSLIAFLSFLLYSITTQAYPLDVEQAAKEAAALHLQKPHPDPDGRIQTMNKKGAMSPQLDNVSEAFVTFAVSGQKKVLEIGAGYGLACLEAIQRGAQDYTVNDLDERHLKILAREMSEDLNLRDKIHNLKLDGGDFLEEEYEQKSFDAILIARVLHFMSPDEALRTVQKMYHLLKPGGKVFAIMLSPYVRKFKAFIPEFEKRIKEGKKFPGFVDDLRSIADPLIVPQKALQNMDKSFLFFNQETAKNLFTAHGFKVELCLEMPLAYSSWIWQLDGRENIGIIVQKEKALLENPYDAL